MPSTVFTVRRILLSLSSALLILHSSFSYAESSSLGTPTSALADATRPSEDDILERALLPPVQSAEDLKFIDAWKAGQKGRLDELQVLMQGLEQYPLYDYLVLTANNLALKRDPQNPTLRDQVKQFIAAHQGQYLGERAATDYLLIAGETLLRRDFNDVFNTLQWNQTEAPIAVAYAALNPQSVSLAQRKLLYRDTSYQGRFLSQLGSQIVNQDPSWGWDELLITLQRQRWNDAKADVSRLPTKRLPTSAKEIQQLITNPSRWYQKVRTRISTIPAKLGLLAALRLAPSNPNLAAEITRAVDKNLSSDEKNLAWATIGYHGATELNAQSLDWFHHVEGDLSDVKSLINPELKLGWYIRTALWRQSWKDVERLTRHLPSDMSEDETWIYWRARALSELGKAEQATPLYRRISGQLSFYGKLASDALKSPYFQPQGKPVTLTPAQVKRWDNDPSIERAKTFYRLEMFFMGHREWNWAMRGLNSAQYNELAEYARSQALLHRMINTAQRASENDQTLEYLFPMPHRQQFEPIMSAQGLQPAWVYGLIRQESRFMPSVNSGVGARGLMQIMPQTARWLAKKLGTEDFSVSKLHDLDMNVQLGSAYLSMVRNDLDGSMVLASAAYNAGPGRARKWRSLLLNPTESAIFIENIPFNETRDYVKNVMANMHTYSLLEGEKLNFTTLLDKVVPNSNLNTDLP